MTHDFCNRNISLKINLAINPNNFGKPHLIFIQYTAKCKSDDSTCSIGYDSISPKGEKLF